MAETVKCFERLDVLANVAAVHVARTGETM
jgi:hypothetical protein